MFFPSKIVIFSFQPSQFRRYGGWQTLDPRDPAWKKNPSQHSETRQILDLAWIEALQLDPRWAWEQLRFCSCSPLIFIFAFITLTLSQATYTYLVAWIGLVVLSIPTSLMYLSGYPWVTKHGKGTSPDIKFYKLYLVHHLPSFPCRSTKKKVALFITGGFFFFLIPLIIKPGHGKSACLIMFDGNQLEKPVYRQGLVSFSWPHQWDPCWSWSSSSPFTDSP